jgi:hypothetical protein
VTKSIGKGVPDHTDKNLAKIKSNAAIKIKLPIIAFNLYCIFSSHP